MKTTSTISIRLNDENKIDSDVLEIKQVLKDEGACFSDFLKLAIISKYQEREREKNQFEKLLEDFERLKSLVNHMKVWLSKNGMPDEYGY